MRADKRNDPDFVEESGPSFSELRKKASAKLEAAKSRKTQSQEPKQGGNVEQEASATVRTA